MLNYGHLCYQAGMPRLRPSKGRLTLSWVSFSRHLPSCSVRSPSQCALFVPPARYGTAACEGARQSAEQL